MRERTNKVNINKIKDKLEDLFRQHRIVFWNDANSEFEDDLSECVPDDVGIVRPDDVGQFRSKVLMEIEQTDKKFLVYSGKSEPEPEEDWLLDIRLYSYQFRADVASMITEELGLKQYHLREHIAKRNKFFANKQRLARLKEIISPDDEQDDIDRKILAVLTKAENDRFFDIVHAVYNAFPSDEGLDAKPEGFASIEKMDMEDVFWKFAGEYFGYNSDNPNLRHLLTCLFISDLSLMLGEKLCQSVRQFVLPPGHCRNAAVCMSEWRDSVRMLESYDLLSSKLADELNIESYLRQIPFETPRDINALKDLLTFPATEKICARAIKEYILSHETTIDKKFVISFCRHRQGLHWSNKNLGGEIIPRDSYWSVYEAFIAITEFMADKITYRDGFSYNSKEDLFGDYTKKLYIFDRYYRAFCEHADFVKGQGWDILKELKEKIEDLYKNWFLIPLTQSWENKINLGAWCVDNVVNQYEFFDKYPKAKAGDKNATVFVIISDGLRYEAAAEIAEKLNSRYRFKADKKAMLGVIPSNTSLGMAALLPHSKITFSPDGSVLVDGKVCASIEQRSEHLSGYNALAIKGDELVSKKREDARELVRDKHIVYLYHNTIDAVGDDAKKEGKVFTAVREAIKEICDMVSFVVNSLNASNVFVTADHGFVFSGGAPGQPERNQESFKDKGSYSVIKKRYLLGQKMPDLDFAHSDKVSNTAGVSSDSDMKFAVPKGMSLFYFTGGAKYFHGGLSLQEVVIPVIAVEQIHGKEKEKTREKSVGVQVLGQAHRITTGKHRFELLQIEAVSERVRPVTFKIGVYDIDEPVTDIQTVSFASASQEISERKREVMLTLKNVDFPSGKTYRLILRNADTDIEEQSIPIRIERVFTSDF